MDHLEGILNRLSAFASTDAALGSGTALELENVAREVAGATPLASETCMNQCTDLLERLHPTSPGTRAIVMLLANLCLRDENRALATQFGIPNTCIVLLHAYATLSAETLYYIFDLVSTLTASDGHKRRMLRPSIPYIIGAMREHPASMDVLLGGCFSLSTLAMLDVENCELIVQRDGVQVLIMAFKEASAVLDTANAARRSGRVAVAHGRQTNNAEYTYVAQRVLRWAKDALLKLCQAPTISVDEALGKVDYGIYGVSIPLDELKWDLTFARKRTHSRMSNEL